MSEGVKYTACRAAMKKTYPRVKELIAHEVQRLGSVNKASLALGLTNNTLGKYLAGQSEPQQETLERLSAYFKRPVAWLRGDTDSTEMPDEFKAIGQAADGHDPTRYIDLDALDTETRALWDRLTAIPVRRAHRILSAIELFDSEED